MNKKIPIAVIGLILAVGIFLGVMPSIGKSSNQVVTEYVMAGKENTEEEVKLEVEGIPKAEIEMEAEEVSKAEIELELEEVPEVEIESVPEEIKPELEVTPEVAVEEQPHSKSLVVYFSVTETTKQVAEQIAEKVDADLFRIEPTTPYTLDDDKLHDIGLAELRNNERPPILASINNLEQYDTVYIGYPIWWSDMPAILYTFLDTYNLEGKSIRPFSTSTTSGLIRTVEQIQKEEPNATVEESLILTDKTLSNADEHINEWLQKFE